MSPSPYAPPRADVLPRVASFRPLGWRTRATEISVLGSTVMGIALVAASSALEPTAGGREGLKAALALAAGAVVAELVSLVTVVSFLLWIHRAAVNVRTLGCQDLEYTPGWCVGWWFVPVASLWEPYGAMKEIWRASQPPDASAVTTAWKSRAVPGGFPVWWITYVAGTFLAMIGSAAEVLFKARHVDVGGAQLVVALSQVLTLVSALLLVSILRQIERRQLRGAAQREADARS